MSDLFPIPWQPTRSAKAPVVPDPVAVLLVATVTSCAPATGGFDAEVSAVVEDVCAPWSLGKGRDCVGVWEELDAELFVARFDLRASGVSLTPLLARTWTTERQQETTSIE